MNMFLWSLPKEKLRSSSSQNKNKETWAGEMAHSLKILMTFQRTQVFSTHIMWFKGSVTLGLRALTR